MHLDVVIKGRQPILTVHCNVALQKRGKKALVLEPSISGPLTLLDAGLSELLTEHGVVK